MTYNIRGGLAFDGCRDTARIAGVVAAERPDIVCFQEVHRRLPWSGWADQPGRLRGMLGMSFVFQANVSLGFGGEGVGVATVFPIRHIQRHRLPSVRETRGVLAVELETPGGPVTVFCTHWGLRREERLRQARATLTHLRAVDTPIVFCGDLNDRPAADYVTAMRQQANLYDCGAETDLATYPSDTPAARIDVVFASPVLRLERLSVINSQASDHRPILAEFQWTAEGASTGAGL